MLPTASERCTYVITNIKACDTEEEQRYQIDYLTKEEFAMHKERIAQSLAANENDPVLKEENDEINTHEKEIERYLGKGVVKEPYTDVSALKAKLLSAVSSKDKAHARAIKSITIWSKELKINKNITLVDVPGYNAPLTMIKDQTNEMIKRADAIVMAKAFKDPDLVDTEVQIIQGLEGARRNTMPISDKIIVALTQFDPDNHKEKIQRSS